MIKNKRGEVLTLTDTLKLDKCPYCSIVNPNLQKRLDTVVTADDRNSSQRSWGIYACASCGGCVLASTMARNSEVIDYVPKNRIVESTIPDRARTYLDQAIGSLHTPSGCLMLCASSVDAMLKAKGYKDGKLFARINKATQDHLITTEMAAWFHHVRIEANEERHDDEETPMPTEEDARKSVDFVLALGEFLFVLPARIAEGLKETPQQ